MKKSGVRKALVAYFDILGIKERLKKANENKAEYDSILDEYHFPIWDAIGHLKKEKDKNYSFQVFSDSFIIHWYINEEKASLGLEIGGLLLTLIKIQFHLALENIFLRGAIDLGNSFFEDNILFSPTMMKAYELESKIAVNPRIVLSSNVVEFYKDVFEGFNKSDRKYFELVIQDADTQYVLNYLLGSNFSESDTRYTQVWLQQHRDRVAHNLLNYKENISVYGKYLWCAKYHNWFCHRAFPKNTELLISPSDDSFQYVFEFMNDGNE